MIKAKCLKCGGTGSIRAFSHVLGGECFSCQGKGFRMQKTESKPSLLFTVSALWADQTDANFNNGKPICVFTIKARSLAQAITKVQKRPPNGAQWWIVGQKA